MIDESCVQALVYTWGMDQHPDVTVKVGQLVRARHLNETYKVVSVEPECVGMERVGASLPTISVGAYQGRLMGHYWEALPDEQ